MTATAQIEMAAAELEEAAAQATRRGMRESGSVLRNRAAGLRQALRILSQDPHAEPQSWHSCNHSQAVS